MLTVFLIGKVWSIISVPLWAKQLVRSTTSMFFIRWEMQCNENGHSYGKLVIGSFIMTMCLVMHHILCSFFDKTSDHPGDSAPLQPRFGTLWLLAFPKTKITFERREISDYWWDSGKYDRAADSNWENCVRSQGAYFEGDWGIIVLCTMFHVSCILFNTCFYFSEYMTGYFLDIPCTSGGFDEK